MIPYTPFRQNPNKKLSFRLKLVNNSANTTFTTPRRNSKNPQSVSKNESQNQYAINNTLLDNYNSRKLNRNRYYPNIEETVSIRPFLLSKSKNKPFVNFRKEKTTKLFKLSNGNNRNMREEKEKKFQSNTINSSFPYMSPNDNSVNMKYRFPRRTKTQKEKEKKNETIRKRSAMLNQIRHTIFRNNLIAAKTEGFDENELRETQFEETGNCYDNVKNVVYDYLNELEQNCLTSFEERRNLNEKYYLLKKALKLNENHVNNIVRDLKKKQIDNDEFLRLKCNINKKIKIS